MALAIHEVLETAAKKRHKADKIQFLQENESWALKDVLRGTYDETIRWNIPVGAPPYEPSQPHNHPASLLREHKKFQYFLVNGPDMPKFKRYGTKNDKESVNREIHHQNRKNTDQLATFGRKYARIQLRQAGKEHAHGLAETAQALLGCFLEAIRRAAVQEGQDAFRRRAMDHREGQGLVAQAAGFEF